MDFRCHPACKPDSLTAGMSSPRVLIYLLRRDLRVADNPVLHEISRSLQQPNQRFTHLLPVYVFAAQQLEVSGFLSSDSGRSPFPEARSTTAGFWRCGPHRAKFLAESVWSVKKSLAAIGSGVEIRVGLVGQVVKDILNAFKKENMEVFGVWMTEEEGVEEKREERDVREATKEAGTGFRLFADEKYFIDDRDIPFKNPRDLPDVFTTYRKQVEPLREAPRNVLPAPYKLLPIPPSFPPQAAPFIQPATLEDTITCLLKPLSNLGLSSPPALPPKAKSAHPFHGGEINGHIRIRHLVTSGCINTYQDTRNGVLGADFSTKLSAWLALGCVTARQVHHYLVDFEESRSQLGKDVEGYGKGENKGTAAIRFELLWRDYFHLATRKFGPRLFRIGGFKNDKSFAWQYPERDPEVQHKVDRFLEGKTGTGFIDASMRELFHTGYTSNRLRQNVASFLAKHLGIDWRIGAEWYESLLCDYDLSNNWGNWQYLAGVGNDPREARVFNPVKQAHDYDPEGAYVKNWVPELRPLDDVRTIFQPWRLPNNQKRELGLQGVEWVEDPLKKIEFHLVRGGGGRGRGSRRGGANGRIIGADRREQARRGPMIVSGNIEPDFRKEV